MRPCKPFESSQAVNSALKEFFIGAKALRDKLGLHDVLIVVRSEMADGDDATIGYAYQEMGEFMAMESLAAYALGKLQAERKEMIAKFLAGNTSS